MFGPPRSRRLIGAAADYRCPVRMRGLVADTRPLRNPHFRRLWSANIITVIGAQLTVVAVPAQIYAETGSSAYVGLTGVFGLVPLVVFGLWGGALADVFDRRTVLIITTLGLIGTSALFWLQAAAGSGNVWLLLGLFSVQQAFFAVNQPTRSRGDSQAGRRGAAPGGELAQHDRDDGRRDRRTAGRRRADPGSRVRVALPDRHVHAVRDALGGGAAAEAAGGGRTHPGARLPLGRRGVHVPAHAAGAADVVPRRHHRDGVRDAAGAVPRDRRTRASTGRKRAGWRSRCCSRRSRRGP